MQSPLHDAMAQRRELDQQANLALTNHMITSRDRVEAIPNVSPPTPMVVTGRPPGDPSRASMPGSGGPAVLRDKAIVAALIGVAGAVIAAVVGAAAIRWFEPDPPQKPEIPPLTATTPTVPASPAITLINVGNYPVGVAVSPDGRRAYITNTDSDTVSVIDTGTNIAAAPIPVGDFPEHVAFSPDGRRAYVVNRSADTVSVIDTGNNTVGAAIAVGDSPMRAAVSRDGRRVYVTNFKSNTVSVIDTGVS